MPKCMHGTIQCGRDVRGGCCPVDTTCSPSGCLRISSADPTPTTGADNETTAENSAATHTGVKLGETGDIEDDIEDDESLARSPPDSTTGLAFAVVFWTILV